MQSSPATSGDTKITTSAAAKLLKTAANSLTSLKSTHALLLRRGFHSNSSLFSLLLSLYSSFSPNSSLNLLSSFPSPSLSLYNSAIRYLSKSKPFLVIFSLYPSLVSAGLKPDNFTFPFLLNSASAISELFSGEEIHSRLIRTGFRFSLPAANALIDMYGKCAVPVFARKVFDEMRLRDLVSFNALLGAHARVGEDMGYSKKVFDSMKERNAISWNAMIVGYVNAGELTSAKEVFDVMPEKNWVSWTTLITGYVKNGCMEVARELFEAMPEKNLVSWTVIITGYSQNGRPREAIGMFREMERAGVEPDGATMTGVISACAQLGNAETANWIGAYVDRKGIERNERVLTALVDMHAKCGNAEEAFKVFEEIPNQDAFSYTALINGLASHGHGLEALDMFRRMQAEGIRPDPITFVGVLNACSHTGLVDKGLEFWESMVLDYQFEGLPEHYACMIDMLARAGRIEEAYEMAGNIPGGPHAGALGALLAACRTYGNVEIAESVAAELFDLEPDNTGNYVLLSSIYASKEQWREAIRVRAKMKCKARKLPGSSWVEELQRAHRLHINNNGFITSAC